MTPSAPTPAPFRRKIICCEVFFRELSHLAARSDGRCDVEFLPKGLHDLGTERMRARLQARIDAVGEDYDAILLVYGLCNNGLAGLRAGATPLVVPRAHDCIALFMGDRARYQAYFDAYPGTYYLTSGWIERDDPDGAGEPTVMQRLGMTQSFAQLVARYGEENARYIQETLGDSTPHYSRLAFIHMGLPWDDRFALEAAARARAKGWHFDSLRGRLDWLAALIAGPWDERDFLVAPPGHTLAPTHGPDIITAVPTPAAKSL